LGTLREEVPRMSRSPQPLNAERFLEAALRHLEPFKGTHIYERIVRDLREKTGSIEAGYGAWLQQLLLFLTDHYHLQGKRILDFGCGTGELTVLMNLLGYQAFGLDIHEKHVELARVLAAENGIPEDFFIVNHAGKLPFPDGFFDVVTMFSVLEHLDDSVLNGLFSEFRRVSRGVIYGLVPNRLMPVDDHTGLRFVPWMPRRMASRYVRMRGRKHGYLISRSGSWDVFYRSLFRILSLFHRNGFLHEFPPDRVVYPPLDEVPPITRIGKHLRIGHGRIFLGIRIPAKFMLRRGYPKQVLYPYLNLLFFPEEGIGDSESEDSATKGTTP
jgi:SAM-dependent methyltransferase